MRYWQSLDKLASEGGLTYVNEPILFRPACHKTSVDVSYTHGSGVIELSCAQCHEHVMSIAVALGHDEDEE